MWSAQTLGAASEPLGYWMTQISFSGLGSGGVGIELDSLGNVYACGSAQTADTVGGQDAVLVKYNSSGSIQWNKFLGGTSNEVFNDIAIDSLDNIYVAGRMLVSGISRSLLVKYNTSGAQQWAQTLGTNTDFHHNSWQAVDTDSDGNVYVAGGTYDTGKQLGIIAKYNSSGTLIWQKFLNGGPWQLNALATTANGASYVAGTTVSGPAGAQDIAIFKYDSLGTVVWQKNIGLSVNENPSNVKIDQSGNVYLCGSTAAAGVTSPILIKLSPDGAIIWQSMLSGVAAEAPINLTIDSSNNIYLGGFTGSQGGGQYDGHIIKYSSNGSLMWQRSIGGTGFELIRDIVAGPNGFIYFLMNTSFPNRMIVGKLGDNGELIGTFNVGTFKATYRPTTFASSSIFLDISNTSYVSSSDSETSGTPTLTDNQRTLSSTTVYF